MGASAVRAAAALLGMLTALPAAARAVEARPAHIETHDNRRSSGRLHQGVLTLSLRAGAGLWFPEGDEGAAREVAALGEEGGPLAIPSPLIRVPAGTTVHVSIRNTLASSLRIHGLCDRSSACAPVDVPPGGRVEAAFALPDAGIFHYWGTTSGHPLALRRGSDSQLGGVIIVDEAGRAAPDRVFLLGMIENEADDAAPELTVINGRSWPHTERLHYAVGDTASWRLVNLTGVAHAMHLHGFFFDVASVGDGVRETRYPPPVRPRGVTHQVSIGGTATLIWTPERAGNWLFHCHMLVHMMAAQGHGSPAHPEPDPPAAGMAGLVLGIHVSGGEGIRRLTDEPRRGLKLVIRDDTRLGDTPSYRVDLQAGGQPMPRVSDRPAPGPVMVLTRGEPVAVEVVNQLREPTAIHWHGIELESYDDGVPGFGGFPGSVTPPVAPGGTFTARFTPARAGTFIYHTHWHDAGQLTGGIYGPLVVLEPGQSYDPVTDHILVISNEGPYRRLPDEVFAVNGYTTPPALELTAGIAHRLRFINITADNVALTVQLLAGFDPVRWTLLAKDGADAPSALRMPRAARQLVAVGETYDFEVAPLAPTAAGLWMELRRGNGELLFQWPVRVQRAAPE